MAESQIDVTCRPMGISVWASDNGTAIKEKVLLIFIHFWGFPQKKHADTPGENHSSHTQSEQEYRVYNLSNHPPPSTKFKEK